MLTVGRKSFRTNIIDSMKTTINVTGSKFKHSFVGVVGAILFNFICVMVWWLLSHKNLLKFETIYLILVLISNLALSVLSFIFNRNIFKGIFATQIILFILVIVTIFVLGGLFTLFFIGGMPPN